MQWVTHFGADDWSFNLEAYDEDEDGESDGSGMPGIGLVASAIFVWLGLQGRPQAPGTIAETFNLPPALAVNAARYHDQITAEPPGLISRPFDRRLACLDQERDHDRWDPDADLSAAISVWASLRDDRPTVDTAAMTFMIPPDRVRAAVEEHYWMFLGAGDVIEHDGA